MTLAGILLLFVSIAGCLGNMVSGFFLAQEASSLDQLHLILAFISLGAAGIGTVLLVRASEKVFESLLQSQEATRERLDHLQGLKQKAFYLSLTAVGLAVLSLITGSLSHAGEWPLIHIILGVALVGSLILSLLEWRKLY